MSHNRFTILFATLVLLLIAVPTVNAIGPDLHVKLARLTVTVTFAAVLLSAAFAVSRSRATRISTLSIAIPTLATQAINNLTNTDFITLANHGLAILFISYTVALLLRHLFSAQRITFDTISASLCAYLLLGVLWSIAYSLLEFLAPGSYVFAIADLKTTASIRFGGQDTVYALYYSFVTMTTLGYGDIVPASSPACMLAAFQAVVGQLFLTVLVARLVGMQISQATPSTCESGA